MELEQIPPEAAAAIEKVRGLVRGLSDRVAVHGVEPVDAALGVAYALHDLALQLAGSPIAAVEWIRTFADLAERGHLSGGLTVTFPADHGQG